MSDDRIKKWKKLSSSYALNEPWFRVRKDELRLPSGKVIDDYFVWESPTIVTVVPFTEDGKFVICQQYRHAIDTIAYQFPAGGVEKGESLEQAALRELEEESGYVAPSVEFLGSSASYPTKLTGWHHLYLARDARPTGKKLDDENEPSRVLLKTPEELWELIDNHDFQIADGLVAAFFAMRRLGH